MGTRNRTRNAIIKTAETMSKEQPTLAEELARLEKEHARKTAEMQDRHKALALMPERFKGVGKLHVGAYKLYGTTLYLHIEHDFFTHFDAVQPTLETVRDLAEFFPPVNMTKVTDQGNCTSFRPTSHVEAIGEDVKEHWKEEHWQVAPFYLEFDAAQRYTVSVKWFATLGAELARIKVVLPQSVASHFFGCQIIKRQGKTNRESNLIASNKLEPSSDIMAIYQRETGRILAEIASPINWGSGDNRRTPGRKSVYWFVYPEEYPETGQRLCLMADLLAPFFETQETA